MTELDLYSKDFTGKEDEIFRDLRGVTEGELLPSDGFLGVFYKSMSHPSTTMFLKNRKKTKFFYIDHDDFICSIMDQRPHWVLDIDKNMLRLNLIYELNGTAVPMVFLFDIAKEDFRMAIKLLARKGVFDLYFLSILYGGLVLEKRVKLDVPKSILKTFKSIK